MSQSDASQLAARHRELRIETYLLVASPLLLFSLHHTPSASLPLALPRPLSAPPTACYSLFLHEPPAMNIDTIPDFLAEQRDSAPTDLQYLFISFEDFWERKLWHQLTDALIEFFNHKESASQRLPFYKSFILTFADKINQLKLVTLALSAATQCRGNCKSCHRRILD
jgi:hypothetical protein